MQSSTGPSRMVSLHKETTLDARLHLLSSFQLHALFTRSRRPRNSRSPLAPDSSCQTSRPIGVLHLFGGRFRHDPSLDIKLPSNKSFQLQYEHWTVCRYTDISSPTAAATGASGSDSHCHSASGFALCDYRIKSLRRPISSVEDFEPEWIPVAFPVLRSLYYPPPPP